MLISENSSITKKLGNIFTSTDSLAHCVCADFEMSAVIARTIRQKYPDTYPQLTEYFNKALWPQFLETSQRYIYHLITKGRFFLKKNQHTRRCGTLCRLFVHTRKKTM